MGTLTEAVISTTYKKLLFQKGDNKLYYTDGSDADSEVTTFASPMSFSGLITAALGIKLSNGTILDSNGNESILLTSTTDAVGYLGITNSATGNAVTITTAGETNVGLTLTPAGTGIVTSTPKFVATAGVQLGNDTIYASDGGAAITLDTNDNVTIGGTLKLNGGEITGITDSTLTLKSDTDMVFKIDNDSDGSEEFQFKNHADVNVCKIDEAGNFTLHSTGSVRTPKISYTDGDTALTIGDGGTLTTAGLLTLGGNLVIPDSGNIGSTTDADAITISSGGVVTLTQNIVQSGANDNTFAGKVLLNGNSGPTAGTGITDASGETYLSWVERCGNMIKTSIYIDIAGLQANGDQKVIGNNGDTHCHLGQITTALNGAIVGGKITCLEEPATGDRDIDLCFDDAADGAEAGDLTGETDLVVRNGDWTTSEMRTFGTVVTANNYLYLRTGTNASDNTYSAGKFLIELWGTV